MHAWVPGRGRCRAGQVHAWGREAGTESTPTTSPLPHRGLSSWLNAAAPVSPADQCDDVYGFFTHTARLSAQSGLNAEATSYSTVRQQ